MNGAVDASRGAKTPKNYKLLIDPNIVKGGVKLYRYEGIIPNDPKCTPVIPRDPRNQLAAKLRTRTEPLEIPVPRFGCSFHWFYAALIANRTVCLDSKLIETTLANHLLLK